MFLMAICDDVKKQKYSILTVDLLDLKAIRDVFLCYRNRLTIQMIIYGLTSYFMINIDDAIKFLSSLSLNSTPMFTLEVRCEKSCLFNQWCCF